MIVRILSLFMLSLLLLGCQPEGRQLPVPAVVMVPPTLPTAVPTLLPTPPPTPTVTATDTYSSLPTPISTKTATREPSPDPTLEPPTAYPSLPTPVELQIEYPDPVTDPATEVVWSYRIIDEFPHDAGAYTQGLVIEDNQTTLLEGTGRDSSLRRVDLQSGQVQQLLLLPDEFFGEGITLFGDRIYQLTWRSGMGFIYDSENFEQLARFFYPHQGWGLAQDGRHLIVSDGSDVIRFWDPETIQEVRQIQVTSAAGPVTQLNELEYVDGEIWANVWHTDLIARISPEDGRVLGWIDLSGLMDPQLLTDSEAVLNGIAYDDASGRLFVTGKLWPSLFEIEVFPAEGS